jgi:hypothetical protein
MASLKKIITSIIMVCTLLISNTDMSEAKPQPSISVQVSNAIINIEARDAVLRDVIQAVSEKTGIVLKLGDPLTELITFSIEDVSAEEALKRLLANRNYTIIFKKTADDCFLPIELRVIGNTPIRGSILPINAAVNTVATLKEAEKTPAPVNKDGKTFTRAQYIQRFQDIDHLSKQITAIPRRDGPFMKGIEITNINTDSVLSEIGIHRGDLISHINGNPIQSVQQFWQSIKSPPENASLVMIGRTMSDGRHSSIYIHLQ